MASAYLTKTLGTPTNNKKFTFSCWVKRSGTSGTMDIFHAGASGSDEAIMCRFESNGQLTLKHDVGNSQEMLKQTTALYRDPNAWYHVVTVFDTDNSTAEDRQRIYVNGERITDFASSDNFAGGEDILGNKAVSHTIGKRNFDSANYLDGILTHVHFCDGQAYDSSYFGETDVTTGIWKPKVSPSVTYGNNGFFLKMDNSGNMGLDSSGNSNNWTTNGTIIQNKDTPTNNTATWDALNTAYTGSTFANANNTLNTGTSNYSFNIGNIGLNSGKWYWETKYVSSTASGGIAALIGIASVHNTGSTDWLGQQATNWGYYKNDGKIRNNGAWSNYGNSYAAGDIIGCALDLENNKLYFSKNGTWQNSGDPTSGSTGTGAISITDPASTPLGYYFAAAGDYDSGKSYQFAINFGDGKFGTTSITSAGSNGNGSLFEYDVPSGYYAVNIKNMAGNS